MAMLPVLAALAIGVAMPSQAAAPLFQDGFESGDLSAWSASRGLAVQQADLHSGSFAARNQQSSAWAQHRLATSQPELFGSLWFKTLSHSTTYTLLRFRTASNVSILRVYVTAGGMLAYRNDVGGVTALSSTVVSAGAWHQLQLRVLVAGATGQVEVWLDGVPIDALARTQDLGIENVGRFEIGNRTTTGVYDVALDDAAADAAFIGGATSSRPTPPQNLRQPTPATLTTVDLAWNESTDDGSIAGYTVYRDNVQVGEVDGSTTTFQDTTVDSDTKYSYTVDAVDDTGLRSARSPSLLVTMPGFTPDSDAVVMAAGDIACRSATATPTTCRHEATSDILMNGDPDAVLLLGDNQYERGALVDYQTYYDPTWGRAKAITHPAPGNHEYKTPGAAEYFSYFGTEAGNAMEGYYSFDLAGWHVISLNSNCLQVGGCAEGSLQHAFLAQDLQETPAATCTLAYWHHPRWSSGPHGPTALVDPLWDLLVARGADVVLVGHDHIYERFAPQDADGAPSDAGVRQFVVGTGGKSHYTITRTANSQINNNTTFGVLKLTLHASSYDWSFVPEVGGTFTDSGSELCH